MPVQIANWAAVGATYFRNYLTTFDFKHQKLYLTPYDQSWQRPQNANQKRGLQVSMFDPGQIVWVSPDSTAFLAGLNKGHKILSINGNDINSLGYFGINKLLEQQHKIIVTYTDSKGQKKSTTL